MNATRKPTLKTTLKSITGVSLMASMSLAFMNCTHHGEWVDNPANQAASQTQPDMPAYQVKSVKNYGVSGSSPISHMVKVTAASHLSQYLAIDGDFSGSSDQVTASCASSGDVSVIVDSDSATEILVHMDPLDEQCTFSVAGASVADGASAAVTLSSSVHALDLSTLFVFNGPFMIGMMGQGGTTASVQSLLQGSTLNYSCDGHDYASLSGVLSQGFPSGTAMQFTLPTIENLATCHFFAQFDSGDVHVQSPILNYYRVTSAFAQPRGTTILLTVLGDFAGHDSFHVSCDNAYAADFSGEEVFQMGNSDAQFQLLTSVMSDLNCEVSASSGDVTSNSFSFKYTAPPVISLPPPLPPVMPPMPTATPNID